jgi:hypothetical protein
VLFPDHLHSHGRTVTARVPIAALGGPPLRSWAYSVHVSGARWERSFTLAERVARGAPEPDAFTMAVLPLVEAWAFGGAPDGSAHPRVIDVLLPRGVRQADVLGSFDVKSGAFARVPFVALEEEPAVAAPPAAPSALTVLDVADEAVTIGGPITGLAPMMIGRVLDADGAVVAHVVVVRVLEGGIVASVVDGRDRIKRGAAVRFEAARVSP